MSFYDRWILPSLLDFVMQQRQLETHRRAVVPLARGRVLEVGIGSGLNLRLYSPNVERIFGLDPSDRLLSMARRRSKQVALPIELLQGSATSIPLGDNSIDAMVMTWTLCSIPDPLAALAEMRRVLRPGGTLHFVEHGLSPDLSVELWQRRLTPLWRHIAGGCHLDRKIDDLIRAADFDVSEVNAAYAEGPRPMAYTYRGRAVRPA